jgi:hypothetical protein
VAQSKWANLPICKTARRIRAAEHADGIVATWSCWCVIECRAAPLSQHTLSLSTPFADFLHQKKTVALSWFIVFIYLDKRGAPRAIFLPSICDMARRPMRRITSLLAQPGLIYLNAQCQSMGVARPEMPLWALSLFGAHFCAHFIRPTLCRLPDENWKMCNSQVVTYIEIPRCRYEGLNCLLKLLCSLVKNLGG